ncbi:Retrograde regulation protein 2 [Nakaseomyces bracarensis]|uniref:Retrograde regulation protein 2 n=1 Tax=Nakaseomyces bracarensis TaxID=273131 RepID=A0ABR4NNA9_9SACH
MSVLSDSDTEAEVVSRNLCAVVDIGSNGIRFSISSKAQHHARIMPCVFKDRLGISLYEIQYDSETGEQIPIPEDIIEEIVSAMKRFQMICEDFGVAESGVRVIATEATRLAINCDEFIHAIESSTGWDVELLSRPEEERIDAYGVVSSFYTVSGLYLDLGGGTVNLSWLKAVDGEITLSPTSVALPYGSSALTRRSKTEDRKALFVEIREAFRKAVDEIGIPNDMIQEAKKNGGFTLMARGGGLRGMGHLLISQDPDYPVQTIINGYSCSSDDFDSLTDYLFLKKRLPGNNRVFKVSEKRRSQLPAVALLMSAAFEVLPRITTIYFSEGGVREGTLYSILPRDIRAQDPLVISTRPYAPLLADKYLQLLKTALPEDQIPEVVYKRVAPALCNLAFIHASYPKELQPTAALHVATRGIISGCHGLSHKIRALIGIALCNRWGGNIPEPEEKYMRSLEDVLYNDHSRVEAKRIVWWTKYIGTIMYVICGVHPGGNIRDNVFDFVVTKKRVQTNQTGDHNTPKRSNSRTIDEALENQMDNLSLQTGAHREFEVIVRISKDDLKTSASVRSRIITLQKKIRKLSRGSPEKVRISVQFSDN